MDDLRDSGPGDGEDAGNHDTTDSALGRTSGDWGQRRSAERLQREGRLSPSTPFGPKVESGTARELPKVLDIGTGCEWVDKKGRRCVVLGIANGRRGNIVIRIRRDNEYIDRSYRKVARDLIDHRWSIDPQMQARADDDVILSTLTKEQRAKVLVKARAAWEVFTGSETGVLQPGQSPRPAYSLDRPTDDRAQSMADELGVSKRSIYRWWEALQSQGVAGLVHGNMQTEDPLARFKEEEIAAARRVVSEQVLGSKKSKKNLIGSVKAEFRAAGLDKVSHHRAKILISELSRSTSGVFGSGKTRKSKASRPSHGGQWRRSRIAGQRMQVDCMNLDNWFYAPGGGSTNGWAVFFIDECTRMASVYLTLSPPSARTIALALFYLMNPRRLPGVESPLDYLPSLPEALEIGVPRTPHPPLVPSSLRMDHGREFENSEVLGLLLELDVDIDWTRPRKGSDKAHVESFIGTWKDYLELLPGHKGNTVENRGDDSEKGPLLTLEQGQRVFDEICAHRNALPHSGLPHPARPKRFMSPNEAYRASLLSGQASLRLPANPNAIYRFFPSYPRVVDSQGVSIDDITYTCRNINNLRELSAGEAGLPGRPLTFHRDPNDISRVFWHEPGTAQWHVLYATYQDEFLPPMSDKFFTASLKYAGRKKLTDDEKSDIAADYKLFARELVKSEAGRKELTREFQRWMESFTCPSG
jgi:hypothetical protein